MTQEKKEYILYAVAIGVGLLVWISLSLYSGKKEAWDTSEYFLFGLPLMCIVAGVIAAIEPDRPWRWALAPLLAQIAWTTISQGTIGNMWPIALFFQSILLLPLLVAAGIGSLIGKRRLDKLRPD